MKNGESIGPYTVLDLIGQGGMGVVYRAKHCHTGELVALKSIRGTDERFLESIRQEIRALAQIDHPGIVRILDEGIHVGLPWYAMKYLSGKTIRQYFSASDTWQTSYSETSEKKYKSGLAGYTPAEIMASWWTTSLQIDDLGAKLVPGQRDIPESYPESEKKIGHISQSRQGGEPRVLSDVATMVHVHVPHK